MHAYFNRKVDKCCDNSLEIEFRSKLQINTKTHMITRFAEPVSRRAKILGFVYLKNRDFLESCYEIQNFGKNQIIIQYVTEPGVDYTHAIFQKTSLFYGVSIALCNEKCLALFFELQCLGVMHIVEDKMLAYLVSWENSESEPWVFYAKTIDLKFGPYLTWPSKVGLGDVIGSNDHHCRYLLQQNDSENVSHSMFVTFLATSCDLTLTYDVLPSCPRSPFSDIYEHFVWVWAHCGTCNQP